MSSAIAGLASGFMHVIIEQPIVCPVETTITHVQINGKNFVWNFKELYKQRALYRALPTAIVTSWPKSTIHYIILNAWMNILLANGDIRTASAWDSTMVGICTGFTEVALINPLSFLKFRMQNPTFGYKGMVDAAQTVYRVEGISAFWKGALPTFLRNSICMAAMLGMMVRIRDDVFPKTVNPKYYGSSLMNNDKSKGAIAGAFAGLIGAFISYPFEILRSARMQNVPFVQEVLSKGFKRLFAGYLPGAARLLVTSAIMGGVLPAVKEMMSGKVKKEDQH